jgi:hypothetical protein
MSFAGIGKRNCTREKKCGREVGSRALELGALQTTKYNHRQLFIEITKICFQNKKTKYLTFLRVTFLDKNTLNLFGAYEPKHSTS